jgi:hypothetical protein
MEIQALDVDDRFWPIAPVGIRPFRGIGDWLL